MSNITIETYKDCYKDQIIQLILKIQVGEFGVRISIAYFAAHRFYTKNGFDEITKADLPSSFPVMEVDSKFYRYRCP